MLVNSEFDPDYGIATLTFNRPKVLNALNVALANDFAAAVEAASQQTGLRCLIIRGAGRAFMAGGDVGDFLSAGDDVAGVIDALLNALNPSILRLRELPCPVLAVAQGAVAGAGLSLLAGCDMVLAADDSQFLMAYDKIGAPPDCGGSAFLPMLVGERKAAELMFSGAVWTAQQALDFGLINRVVTREQLDSDAIQFARQLAAGPTKAFGEYKAARNRQLYPALAAHLEAEREAFKRSTATADFREGIAAFAERRKADFSGH